MAERRARILETARGLIAAGGWRSLQMRSLARASGVSVPTLYNLFGSKEALLGAAIADHVQRVLETTPGPGIEGLLGLLERAGEEVERMPRYTRSVLRSFLAPEDPRGVRHRVALELGRALVGAVRALQRERQLVDWVYPRFVADRLTANAITAVMAWASGLRDAEGMRRDLVAGSCLVLLGVARGRTRSHCETRLRQLASAPATV